METIENFSTIFYVMFAIQIITVIVFFVMAYNVSVIKKRLSIKSVDEYVELAKMEGYIGNKDEAKKYYMRARYMTTRVEFAGTHTAMAQKQIDEGIAELDKT